MNARGLLAAGYVRRGDGTLARTITFEARSPSGGAPSQATETLIRSSTGKLLRVERSKRALLARSR